MTNFYTFSANSLHGTETSMKEFEGKTILVVNTASKCGLTPQFTGLENLYQKYKNQGLVILGFPCNQFMDQEPGDAESIEKVCSINYGVTFPMFAKIEINGPNTHPIYEFLKSEKTQDLANEASQAFAEKTKNGREIFDKSDIVWNFGKFLINKNEEVIERFSPVTEPKDLETYIKEVL